MKKSAIIFFHAGNAVQRSCDGIEIVPGEIHLMNEKGEVMERYKSAYIKAFCYDGKEFPLIPINRKEKKNESRTVHRFN